MRSVLKVLDRQLLARAAFIGAVGGIVAGCSMDSDRFKGNPFSDPFTTGSIEHNPRPAAQSQSRFGNWFGSSSGFSQQQPQYQQQSQPQPVVVAPSNQPVVTVGQGGWTANGGTRISVGENDTIHTISNRYGVPANALLSANNLSNGSQIVPGREIIVPIYDATGTAQSSVRATGAAVSSAVVRAPYTGKDKVAEAYGSAKQATAQRPVVNVPEKPGSVAVASRQASVAPAPPRRPVLQAAAMPVATPVVVKPNATAEIRSNGVGTVAKPAVAVVAKPTTATPAARSVIEPVAAVPQRPEAARHEAVVRPVAVEEPAQSISADGTDFRWPARGRVISGFNAASGNDGINIALPEGTPVKATESGTVAYAGDEVKGYGNLVLIRHDNGFVSAYAHNGDLNVKRGERVKRGQTIAVSGKSGNVTSPQLHFELRKGSTPVDPIQRLSGL